MHGIFAHSPSNGSQLLSYVKSLNKIEVILQMYYDWHLMFVDPAALFFDKRQILESMKWQLVPFQSVTFIAFMQINIFHETLTNLFIVVTPIYMNGAYRQIQTHLTKMHGQIYANNIC